MTTLQATGESAAPPPAERGRLHRPWRALVAVLELVLAGVAVWAAFWCWGNASGTISTVIQPPDSGPLELESSRSHGNWMAIAIGLGTVAALLVLDALRQAVLAFRARSKQPPDPD